MYLILTLNIILNRKGKQINQPKEDNIMICITWYEPTDDGFQECHYVCDKLGAYEYDELLWIIKAENYEYYIEEIE